ncbi:MAG: 50S ribosomal protein L11 methyltransferase [Polyangiaceae bacterium]|nr:50S ribosomal protein L11 methyltransferase [Polyangiaceae bacterium]
MEPRYPFVAVDVPSHQADDLSAGLFELGASGVEERDDQTLIRGAGQGRVTLVASFSSREDADAAIEALRELDPDLSPRLEEVVGDAWRDAWKEHFAPFPLTSRITVVPPWVDYTPAREGERVRHLEPGRAFGTGLHATTSLVAELLDARAPELAGREVLDVGTGSGILALAALLLGASRAAAIDIDPDVIEVVIENAARNGLESRISASAGTVETITRPYPWVLANIEARVLRPLGPELVRVLAPGGCLVLSGILASEHDEMVHIYTSLPRRLAHLESRRRIEESGEGWVAIAFSDAARGSGSRPHVEPPGA